jgi:hypothetical protein
MNEELIIQKSVTDPTDKLCQIIAEKRAKNTQLNFAINDYVSLKLAYEQKNNELLLTTDFKQVTGESRPTVAMKEAYIENPNMSKDDCFEVVEAKLRTLTV